MYKHERLGYRHRKDEGCVDLRSCMTTIRSSTLLCSTRYSSVYDTMSKYFLLLPASSPNNSGMAGSIVAVTAELSFFLAMSST